MATAIPGNSMAAFSSRGENRLSSDIIKPDVTAPGVNILAGNTPTPTSGPSGDLFQAISGTSMSSPHVAGLMALLVQAHPDWTPAEVKSALMTTARQNVTKEDGVTPADPFDMGAGHVDPPSMFDPGLVYDAGLYEYAGFTCFLQLGLFTPGSCDTLASLGFVDPSDYNQASIGIGELPGSETVTRSVTNVTDAPITVTAEFAGLSGISASMSPSTLEVAAGATESFDVTFEVQSAPVDEWNFGSMTLVGDGYTVYSPIAVRPATLGAADVVSATIAEGTTSFDVSFGYTGEYTAAAHGLVAPDTYTGTVGQDADQTFDPSDVAAGGAVAHTVSVSGAALLRIAIPPLPGDPNTDLDLYVYGPDGSLVGVSGNGGTDEVVDLFLPDDGIYTFYVHGWGVGEVGDTVDYSASTWAVSATPGGSLEIQSAPASATIGTTAPVTIGWPTDLAAGDWLGLVSHSDASGVVDLTVVEVSG